MLWTHASTARPLCSEVDESLWPPNQGGTAAPHSRPVRILVVDDDEAIQSHFQRIFSAAHDPDAEQLGGLAANLFGSPPPGGPEHVDYRVRCVSQGDVAATFVREASEGGCPVDVAFVDMRMPPGWNGVRTTAEMWAFDPLLQVVLCTAYSDFHWADVMRFLGTTEHLHLLRKPFSATQVRQIANILATKANRLRRTSR